MSDTSITFDISKAKGKLTEGIAAAIRQCGLHALRESKRNAPRSPTMKQRSATLVRKRRTKQKSAPGGLERSIVCDIMGDTATIYILQNSAAGKYARRIHDEKGKTWWKRGAGTVAKGNRADEKFIQRALKDNAKAYEAKLAKAVESALKAV